MKSRFLSSVAKKGFSARNIAVIIFGAIVLISLFRTGYSFFEMKSVRDSLNEEITRLSAENKQKEARIGNLYADREFIERAAREQLNMVKEGETVYIISRD
jgi:cell division protein FtsB